MNLFDRLVTPLIRMFIGNPIALAVALGNGVIRHISQSFSSEL